MKSLTERIEAELDALARAVTEARPKFWIAAKDLDADLLQHEICLLAARIEKGLLNCKVDLALEEIRKFKKEGLTPGIRMPSEMPAPTKEGGAQ